MDVASSGCLGRYCHSLAAAAAADGFDEAAQVFAAERLLWVQHFLEFHTVCAAR